MAVMCTVMDDRISVGQVGRSDCVSTTSKHRYMYVMIVYDDMLITSPISFTISILGIEGIYPAGL